MSTNFDRFNPHWIGVNLENYLKHRDIFKSLSSKIDRKLMTFLIGPRRVGKSVLLKQLLSHLITEKNVKPSQILYWEFSPRDPKEVLQEVLDDYIYKIADVKSTFYLFLDEIQYVKAWESMIKIIYDQYPNVRIIITGSLSLSYKRRMEESLAGRFLPVYIFPLNFKEYLNFKGKSELFHDLNQINTWEISAKAKNLNADFVDFLQLGRYPDTLNLSPIEANDYIKTIQYQTLGQDSVDYFQIEKVNILQGIFEYFRINSGGEVSYAKLAQVLNGVRPETISKYVDILELLRLIYIVPNTSNPLKATISNRKIYVNSAFSLNNLNSSFVDNLGLAAESYVLEQLLQKGDKISYFRHRSEEVDFIQWKKFEEIGKFFAGNAFEVKYQHKIDPKDSKNLKKISQKLNLKPNLLSLDESLTEEDLTISPICLF